MENNFSLSDLSNIDYEELAKTIKDHPELEITPKDLEFLKKFEQYVQHNGILFYEPIPKVVPFHKSSAPYRLLHGANRSSKSYSGACEDVWYALGNHPYKKIQTPNEGWVVSPSYKQQVEGIQSIILKMIPKANIRHISHIKGEAIDSIWVIPWGAHPDTPKDQCSKITFKSGENNVREFAGAAKRWIHFDEEPKFEHWKESIARIGAGMPLDIWLTMTPIFEDAGKKVGMTWTYRELYRKADNKRIQTFGVGVMDNIYLTEEQIEEQKKKYHGAEYDIRIKGEFKLLAGNQVFDPEAIERHSATCTDPEKIGRLDMDERGRIKFISDPRGYLKIYKEPEPGVDYAIGADIGLGVGGDPSAAVVRSMRSLDQMAEIKGQIAPDIMAHILQLLGHYYNKAWIGVEANSFGIATINVLKAKYSKLYFRYKVDQRTDKRTRQVGWWTDTKTKPIMIADYGEAMRNDVLKYRSSDLLDECMTYVIGNDGTANAESGCHDDLVIADMICFQVRKRYFHVRASSYQESSYSPANKISGY